MKTKHKKYDRWNKETIENVMLLHKLGKSFSDISRALHITNRQARNIYITESRR